MKHILFILLFFLAGSQVFGQWTRGKEIGGNTRTMIKDSLEAQIVYNDSLNAAMALQTADIDTLADMAQDVHDGDLDANRNIRLDPEWARYTNGVLAINETNLDTDSAFAILDMNGYHYFSVQLNSNDSTQWRAYWTNNADASNTDSDDGNWTDFSVALLGADSVANPTNLGYVQSVPFTCEKVMFKLTTLGATNSATAYPKRSK